MPHHTSYCCECASFPKHEMQKKGTKKHVQSVKFGKAGFLAACIYT
jgi:hypothetical protein